MSFKDSKAQILANSASDDSDISTMEADLATSITDSFGTMSYKTWTVTIVEFKLESTFDDTLIYTDTDVVFRYTP